MSEKKETVMTREVILTLPKLREQGLTNIQIAKNIGVSIWTVGYWFKRLKNAGHTIPQRNYKGGLKKIEL
jgi:transposase